MTKELSALRGILQHLYSLPDDGARERKISRIRREAIFFLYEGGEAGKWDPERPHSAAARKIREAPENRGANPKALRLRYDHAIPIAELRNGLPAALSSEAKLKAFLRRYVQDVVLLESGSALT